MTLDRAESVALRRVALAVSVLDEVDLLPTEDGVLLPGEPAVDVPWSALARATRGSDLESRAARRRLARFLRCVRALADIDRVELGQRARPYGVPADARNHPGRSWVCHEVPGGALDVGIGVLGLLGDPDRVDVLPPGVPEVLHVDATAWWPDAVEYLERMAALAASRIAGVLEPVLRPMGDCDVVTLLASPTFRRAVCGPFAGMRTAAVPMRTRGWLDLRRIDPAFAPAAAAATPEDERGFSRPLLLTADSVMVVHPTDRIAEIALNDRYPRAVPPGAD